MLTFEELYSWVKDLPIIDWHNHLDLDMLAADKPLGSLYEVWVKADPYKHRAMRICGEPEELITGGNGQDARCPSGGRGAGTTGVSPVEEDEKWSAWMRTLPKLVGSPLFAWAKMELEFLGLDADSYLHGRGGNISLSDWTPSRLLSVFNVAWMSPCVGASQLGQRASRPLTAYGLGQRASRPLTAYGLGQRASRPLTWTESSLHLFPAAGTDVSNHLSHTLSAGDFHRRNLPHLGQNGTLVFVTFRLGDSLPADKLAELEAMRKESSAPGVCGEAALTLEQVEKIDAWLDAGHGECLLADTKCREIVENALEFFNATGTTGVSPVGRDDLPFEINGRDARCPSTGDVKPRYRLHGYVVMPNHVHVLLELFEAGSLSRVLQSWKSFTAKEINRELGRSGPLWKEEYYDRLIRNGEHYQNILAYLQKNAAAARALARGRGCNGRDARCPSDAVNGRDARCPSNVVCPSLRMNAGESVSQEALEMFQSAGCRIVDISVDEGRQLESEYESLSKVATFAARHGWTMLLHLGALRETSARLRAAAGPVGGFAGMRAPVDPANVARFLNRLEGSGTTGVPPVGGITGTTGVPPVGEGEKTSSVNGQDARCPSGSGGMPRTILLSLNPEAHAQLAVLAGSFNGEGMPGKVQLGPAWWWCDHEEGIRDVLEKNAAYGVLSTFVGMTTDSRSLLSFVRHDYFRRILCRWTAEKVAAGAFPDDAALLRPMLENICYRNAKALVP